MAERILFVNGSLRGTDGNSGMLLGVARRSLPLGAEADEVVLAEYAGTVEALADRFRRAEAILVATGVYWSSWGSPLQRFFEVFSGYELSGCFFGKPAGAIVSMDSVGGADVAQRLLGVLGWFGCTTPPLASVVLSRTGAALAGSDDFEDVFQTGDVAVLVHNLFAAIPRSPPAWRTWPITQTAPIEGPYPHAGPLSAGLPRFGESRRG